MAPLLTRAVWRSPSPGSARWPGSLLAPSGARRRRARLDGPAPYSRRPALTVAGLGSMARLLTRAVRRSPSPGSARWPGSLLAPSGAHRRRARLDGPAPYSRRLALTVAGLGSMARLLTRAVRRSPSPGSARWPGSLLAPSGAHRRRARLDGPAPYSRRPALTVAGLGSMARLLTRAVRRSPSPGSARWPGSLLAPSGAHRRRARLGGMTSAQQVTEFEALRPHLMSVAYRLTGTVADAEDIVQEAWLRWDRHENAITDLRAWLTTVVSRLGLDRLRSAAHRR